MSYSYSKDDERAEAAIDAFKDELLERYRGKLLLSVNESELKSGMESFADPEGNLYVLERCYKEFPCTLNITLRERRDTFVREAENGNYEIYDENGVFLRNADENGINNKLDGAPNIILNGADTRARVLEIAEVCKIFAREFSALRSVVDSVELSKAVSQYDYDRISFRLRCGLSVELRNYLNLTEQKLNAAATVFGGLNGEQKLRGEIYVLVASDGTVRAEYSPYPISV